MTIHTDPESRLPYVLLADVPLPDRCLLQAWLVGMEAPEGGVYLKDYLRFVREMKERGQAPARDHTS